MPKLYPPQPSHNAPARGLITAFIENKISTEMKSKEFSKLNKVSGYLCLDFLNTVERGGDEKGIEWLKNYSDIIGWAKTCTDYAASDVEPFERLSLNAPGAAGGAFNKAIAIRETLRNIFTHLAAGATPSQHDLDNLSRELRRVYQGTAITVESGKARFTYTKTEPTPEDLITPVLMSAVKLLDSTDCARLKKCARADCLWLFIDTSKSRNRRWCEMGVCGNRTKNKAFHHNRSHQQNHAPLSAG